MGAHDQPKPQGVPGLLEHLPRPTARHHRCPNLPLRSHHIAIPANPQGGVSVLGLEWLRRCRDTHLLNISPAAARSRLAATVCAASPSSSTATVCSMVSTSSEAIGADGGGGGGLLGPPCPGSGSGFGLPPARPGSGGGVRSARIQSTAPPSAAISVVCSLPRHKGWGKVSGAVDLLVAPSLS